MQRSATLLSSFLIFISFSFLFAQDFGSGDMNKRSTPVRMSGNSANIEYPTEQIMFEGKPINESHTVMYDSKTNDLKISVRDAVTMPPDHPLGIGSTKKATNKGNQGVMNSSLNKATDLRYSITMESNDNGWAWWYNFDWDGFSEKITDNSNQGRRLQNVDTYGYNDAYLYAGTWSGDGQGSAWALNYQDANAFIALLNAWPNADTRIRPIDFAIHPFYKNTQLYGVVGVADNKGFTWIFNADFTTFNNWISDQWANGRRIINVEVYHQPGSLTPSYAGISEDGGYAQEVWFNLTWDGFVTKFNENVAKNNRPLDFSESSDNRESRYAGIWNGDGVQASWVLNYTDVAQFQTDVTVRTDGGFRPRTLNIFDAIELTGLEPGGLEIDGNSFRLNPNYPNPFNPSTTINFSLSSAEFVTLKIYNILGEELAILVSEQLPAGNYDYNWNAKDKNGNNLSTGVYFYKLSVGDNVSKTHKMVLVK